MPTYITIAGSTFELISIAEATLEMISIDEAKKPMEQKRDTYKTFFDRCKATLLTWWDDTTWLMER